MTRVLERQFGAVAFDIDSIEGYAKFSVVEPQQLTREQIFAAFSDANYESRSVEVRIRGRIGADGRSFVVEGTGQKFTIAGADHPAGWSGELEGYLEPGGQLTVMNGGDDRLSDADGADRGL